MEKHAVVGSGRTPETGQWIDNGRNRPPTCSVCGGRALLDYESEYCKSDYCPHCGSALRTSEEP